MCSHVCLTVVVFTHRKMSGSSKFLIFSSYNNVDWGLSNKNNKKQYSCEIIKWGYLAAMA